MILFLAPGCVKEEYIQYDGQDVLEEVTLESPQACADRCASSEEGLFWTFGLNSKACQVKKSLQGRRGIMYTVSGTRNCGLFNMSGRTDGRLDHIKVVVSKEDNKSPPNQCADNNNATVCTVPASPAPWLALDLGSKHQVNRVEIRNTKFGGRVRDFEVRVTDSLPPSGTHSISYTYPNLHLCSLRIFKLTFRRGICHYFSAAFL